MPHKGIGMETLKCRQTVHCSKVDKGIFIGFHDIEDEYTRKDVVMNHEYEKAKMQDSQAMYF